MLSREKSYGFQCANALMIICHGALNWLFFIPCYYTNYIGNPAKEFSAFESIHELHRKKNRVGNYRPCETNFNWHYSIVNQRYELLLFHSEA